MPERHVRKTQEAGEACLLIEWSLISVFFIPLQIRTFLKEKLFPLLLLQITSSLSLIDTMFELKLISMRGSLLALVKRILCSKLLELVR